MIKLIVKIQSLPEGTIVRRPNGEKPYTVRDKLTIYGRNRLIIVPDDKHRFLVAGDGSANEVSWDDEVAVWGEHSELIYLLQTI